MLLLVAAILAAGTNEVTAENSVFGSDFAWGVSTAAYQIEGAWNTDGKGPSIWDEFTRNRDVGDANISIDSYHRYRQHVFFLGRLKVTHYKFSISWSRVLPDGTLRSRNEEAIQFYKDLVTELHRYKITPVVCLYHHDLPNALQNYGGWMNQSTVDVFENYARLVFTELGPLVQHWITMTSPWNDAYRGYGDGSFAPGITQPETAPYIVAHNMIRAHVRAYHVYNDEFRHSYKGVIGIVLNTDWQVSATSHDSEAAARAMMFSIGWFAQPLFGNGDYPEVMKTRIATMSPEGVSRLPSFTAWEIFKNRGSSDFFGITKDRILRVTDSSGSSNTLTAGYDADAAVNGLEIFSSREHVRDLLLWIQKTYNNPTIYYFDAGFEDCGTYYDEERIQDLQETVAALRTGLSRGIPLAGFFYPFTDGYHWLYGYHVKFGLYHSDFKYMEIAEKASAKYYVTLIQKKGKEFEHPKHFTPEELRQRHLFLRAKFPPDFIWGVATSAFQTEGGWNEGGKGPSIWDTFAHNKQMNGTSGDVACDSYHKWREDIENIKKLGVSHYRFSIAWTRIMPDGRISSLNQDGVDFYNNFIDQLLANGITPMVTLYHWDLPQALDSLGGFLNSSIIDYFNDYARVCFELFGDRVPIWVTFNEPLQVTFAGYAIGLYAPGIATLDWYNAVLNLIRAHAKAYHTYDKLFRPRFHGKVGITFDISWNEPANTDAANQIAAERALQFQAGLFAEPIFGSGDFPAIVRAQVDMKSRDELRNASRLPRFTQEEIKMNKGSADFFGLNTYTTYYVVHNHNHGKRDRDLITKFDNCWTPTAADWLTVNPWGLRSLLRWVRDRFNNPPVYVTENGYPDDGELNDQNRISYLKAYTNEILKAIYLDNCDVKGYVVWSLMDTVEWIWGLTNKFGLFQTDFSSPNRTRTMKASAEFYAQLIRDNGYI